MAQKEARSKVGGSEEITDAGKDLTYCRCRWRTHWLSEVWRGGVLPRLALTDLVALRTDQLSRRGQLCGDRCCPYRTHRRLPRLPHTHRHLLLLMMMSVGLKSLSVPVLPAPGDSRHAPHSG